MSTLHNSPGQRKLLDMFDKPSFLEKVKMVGYGLKQPHDSGAYKYARLQITRLLSPLAGIVVPIIALFLLLILAAITPEKRFDMKVNIKEEAVPEELEEPEELPDEEIEPPDPIEMEMSMDDNPMVSAFDAPEQDADFSPQPSVMDSVAIVKSPIVMRGIYGSRNPGSRGSALGKYGGGKGTEDAVMRALRWLKKHQAEDGSWAQKTGGGELFTQDVGDAKPALTGLALLAFLAHGETPGSEEFGATVEKSIKWLMDNLKADGHFKGVGRQGQDAHEYSQPIATYALCEAYGLTKIPMLKEPAERSIDVIIRGQHPSGSWDYNCIQSERDDVSYGGWCVQALKAAKMASLDNANLEQALKKSVAGLKGHANELGMFTYTPGSAQFGGRLTAVGVLGMQLLGAAKEKEARHGLTWLKKNVGSDWEEPWGSRPIYAWYYVTQAMFHEGGGTWTAWNNKFAKQVVEYQTVVKGAGIDGKDVGYWDAVGSEEKYGRVYHTTLCALMLEVYYRYLPTYQIPEQMEEGDFTGEDDIEVEIIM